jgi:hypothetical protein
VGYVTGRICAATIIAITFFGSAAAAQGRGPDNHSPTTPPGLERAGERGQMPPGLQDQAVPVPDGGSTLMLLGIGLAGTVLTGTLLRKFRSSR